MRTFLNKIIVLNLPQLGRSICVWICLLLISPMVALGQGTMPRQRPTTPSPDITVWADIRLSDDDEPGTTSGFNQGQIVLHFSSSLTPKTSVFSEISFSSRSTGTSAGIERILIRFDQSDLLKLSIGRDHTPINWWNVAFHHGLWLQTSIDRPEMTKFGGDFIPVHFVGAMLGGSHPANGLNFNYIIGAGNGRNASGTTAAGDTKISGAGRAGDDNNNRALFVNVFTRPDRFFGLQTGAAIYIDTITLDDMREFDEWIASFHIVWEKENPEFIAEFANVNHKDTLTGLSTDSQAYYVQVAYRLSWFEALWKPYYRFETFDIPTDATLLAGKFNEKSSIFGLRYDISLFAALRAEYRRHQRPNASSINAYFGQVSFMF